MERLYAIQYLRAVAAISVVTLHAGHRVSETLPASLSVTMSLGHAGVDLFFVISGFIMWTIGRTSGPDPVEFLRRRAIRVLPLYWLATVVWVGGAIAVGFDWIVLTPEHVILSLLLIPHFSATFPAEIWPVLVPGWTLSFEFLFYLLFAMVLRVAEPFRMLALASILIGLVACGEMFAPISAIATVLTSPLLIEFLAGCAVGALVLRHPGDLIRNALLIATGLSVLAVFGAGIDHTDNWARTIGFGGPAALIVAGAAGLGPKVPLFTGLARLGDASYAIYLFHLFLVIPLAAVWQHYPAIHSAPAAILFVLVAVILSSFLGRLIFQFIETPMQRALIRNLAVRTKGAHVVRR